MAQLVAAAAAAAAAASANSAKAATVAATARSAAAAPPPPPPGAAPAGKPQLYRTAAELEQQADELAAKALAALPENVRAQKLPAVRASILKRLAAQVQIREPSTASASELESPPPAGGSETVHNPVEEDEDADRQRLALRRPPTELPTPQDGVEACGDDPWFADPQVRIALRDAVAVAHADFKILVRDPAEEIVRILPPDGRQLRAGAVLRLGGYHLGGYAEADVSYAYRQLSRACHPDKNPGNADAATAFKRLAEAQTELKHGVEAMRRTARHLGAQFRSTAATDEDLTRPQEVLFAESARLLAAVLCLATEGKVPPAAQARASACLVVAASSGGGNWALPFVDRSVFLENWFGSASSELLSTLGTEAVRSAYDCAPKRYRAHFLCLLARLALLEAERSGGSVRQSWSTIWEAYPELSLWQQLRELLRKKCQVHGKSAAQLCGQEPETKKQKKNHADAEEGNWSQWARRWRKMIRAVLPRGEAAAAPWADAEVRKLCAALWRDFADPLERKDSPDAAETRRCFSLFRTESRGAADVAAQRGAAPAEWAFVPAVDMLLIVGDGIVGTTVEGVFADGATTTRLPFATAIFQTMM